MRASALIAWMVFGASLVLAAAPPGKGSPDFEKMKSLAGVWQGKDKEGKPIQISYKVISGGTAVMENLEMKGHAEAMVTIYHMDGDHLMMTHYCTMGNQPRMKAEKASSADNAITFSFVDATNLASPDDPHMHGLVITFNDKDHFTQEWTLRANGKDTAPDLFSFVRSK